MLIEGEINLQVKNEIAIFIYRIVNELLQNVLKHARATRIVLETAQVTNKYVIIVQDNGIGFDKDKQGGNNNDGFGLMSIKERLESLKGRLYLKSEPGSGTIARIEIPLNNNNKN